METFISIILSLLLFSVTNIFSYVFVEKLKVYEKIGLNFKPFSCLKCFNFWCSLITFSTIFWLTDFKYIVAYAIGLILTATLAASRHYLEKHGYIDY